MIQRSGTTSRLLLLAVIVAATAVPFGAARSQEGNQQSLLETIGPFRSHGHVYDENNIESMRPRVMGTRGVVSTGHYLATMAP